MSLRVDARDVLDVNARTRRSFQAKVVGHFRRVGPNRWDDYEYVSSAADAASIDVYAALEVQLETVGAELRLRRRGRVVRVAWQPSDDEEVALADASASARRAYFIEHYVRAHDEKPGMGAAAVIASKLVT